MFSVLAPKEQVTISYLYFPPMTYQNVNTYVSSDEGSAKIVKVIPTVELPKWIKTILYVILFVGLSKVINWVIVFLSLMQHYHNILGFNL